MSKKLVVVLLVGMLLLLAVPGIAGANGVCDVCPGESSGEGFDPGTEFVPLERLRERVPEPDVDPSWIRFRGLDRHHVTLGVGASVVVNLDVPAELAPYQLSWMSLDTGVATVVANSPARITGAGVGETWVVAVVQTDEHTYYDAVLVDVVGPEDVAAGVAAGVAADDVQATPPTAGGIGYFYSVIYGLLVSIGGIIVLRRIGLES